MAFKDLPQKTQDRIVRRLLGEYPLPHGVISEALGVSAADIIRVRDAGISQIVWTRGKIVVAVREFIMREKRWPKYDEFRRRNDLPSMHTVRSWGTGGTSSDWIQADLAMIDDLDPIEAVMIPNATHRAKAMAKLDMEAVIKSGVAKPIKKDKFGRLFSIQITKTDRLRVVEVTNSTAEPDGSFTKYYLRVPPTMETPKQAVAWTFGVTTGWRNFKIEKET